MNPFDSVLKMKADRRPAKGLARFIVGTATVAVLILSPQVKVVAAPATAGEGFRIETVRSFQNDDAEIAIVPSGGADETTSETPSKLDVVTIDLNGDATDSGSGDPGDRVMLTGIVNSKTELSPDQWTGALDGRLVEPFALAPRPARVRSSAIDLDAVITTREIVGGEMQTPRDENEVTWYKETARPGEKGNMVFAGHLNWYGVPEAVFYNIDEFEKGDKIVVTGEDDVDYVYTVKWVKLVETADVDMQEIAGPTEKASLTLITCGGEWDPAAGQYKQRTVVRAELVQAK